MKSTILIIEDNRLMLDNTTELLKLAGYNVSVANNGKEGLERAMAEHPDLVFCDIFMPELDGYGVLRAMKNIPELEEVPFVFFTGSHDKKDFRKAMDLGADDFLNKPFEADELLRIAESKLKKREQLKQKVEVKLKKLEEFMGEVSTFDEISRLTAMHAVKKIKNKHLVYSEGDSAVHLYFVVSGKIKIFRTNESGKEFISNIHNPGEFFGYTAILNDSGLQKQS
ncbi:MAG TPA: response regulator, partial [Bacteroidia bacterium]|nr:response regulator [Bacteroidia bacterium]